MIVISAPTRLARKWIEPDLFIVADVTVSPGRFSTGILSPVIVDSSTLVVPWQIVPSAGMRSPGRTIISSPMTNSSMGITDSIPLRSTDACLGASLISFSIAALVFPLARVSKYLPTVINVTIIPADSKYRLVLYVSTSAQSPCPMPHPMRKMAKAPKTAEAIDPMPTKLSILGAPWKRLRNPLI